MIFGIIYVTIERYFKAVHLLIIMSPKPELYQQAHRFDISDQSFVGLRLLQGELFRIQGEFNFVKGLGFYGSRTKGKAREFNLLLPWKRNLKLNYREELSISSRLK